MHRIPSLTLLLLLTATVSLRAQTVPALLLSDIHLDPYHDPTKIAKLNTAPASEWAAILAEADSPRAAELSASLQQSCRVRGIDTPNTLWRSSLRAIHAEVAAAAPKFITISGDLLAHQFDCKYKTLLPTATHADFVAFAEKTIRYLISSLETTLPNTPIYLALGNNDSACADYQLAPAHDELLALTARIAAETVPEPDRTAVLSSFAATGSYSAPLAGVPNTRIVVLDDLYLSAHYVTCTGAHDSAPAAAQLAWLSAQLDDARAQHQHVWILGHIPPAIDIYTTARRLTNVCGGGKPVLFLSSDQLSETIASHADVVQLALFGHTHNDEFLLLRSPAADASSPAVPVKITASITPVNGNRPTFTVAKVDAATATLKDFTVYEASNATGIGAIWKNEYTYSAAYHEPAYDAHALDSLIAGFRSDPQAEQPASKAYLRNYFPGDLSSILQFAWPEYTCGMENTSTGTFAACLCRAAQPATSTGESPEPQR